MLDLPGLGLRFSAGAMALMMLALLSPWSGATAGQFSVGVIEYNAKASQGGWSRTGKPPPLPLQLELIANKVKDTSNSSPVQFIALVQAGDGGTHGCTDDNGKPNDFLISCALNRKGVKGWNTIISICNYDQTQLAYSPDWKLVKALVDDYGTDSCWTDRDSGRPYNIAYFQNGTSNEKLLFVIVHMPHGYPDDCQTQPCPYGGGKFAWNVPQFKTDVRSVVGAGVDLTTVRLLIAGDMNDLGNDADPKRFAPIFDDFGAVKISKQAKSPPDPTCCTDNGFTTFFDRIVTNDPANEPSYEVVYLTKGGKIVDYPLNKQTIIPNRKDPSKPRHNEEHKATYGVAKFN